jgi:hypothetical protein
MCIYMVNYHIASLFPTHFLFLEQLNRKSLTRARTTTCGFLLTAMMVYMTFCMTVYNLHMT